MTDIYPLLIQPSFDERIWGGHDLARLLGKAAPANTSIGESWEVYDTNQVINGTYAGKTIAQLRGEMGADLMGRVKADHPFPLLTKLIDAHDVLSVQVHPDDSFAQRLEHEPNGKTECWYVIHAEPDAALTYGFSRNISPDEYTRLVEQGTLDQVLRRLPVAPGDVIYIPAGMVHAIGAGIIVYELQQSSDVTYRIYDWNRRDNDGKTRELHVDKARQVLDYRQVTGGKIEPLADPTHGRTMLIAGPYFTEELIEAGRAGRIATEAGPVVICALERAVALALDNGSAVTLERYSSALVPAAAGGYTLTPAQGDSDGRALVASIPESQAATREDLRARGFSADQVDRFLAQFAPLEGLGQAAS